MCETYNGYSNYQTWVTSLWLDNEPYTNEYLYKLANREPVHESEIAELVDKADDLEGYVRDMLLGDSSTDLQGMGSDLYTHAISAINWREIVSSHKEEEPVPV